MGEWVKVSHNRYYYFDPLLFKEALVATNQDRMLDFFEVTLDEEKAKETFTDYERLAKNICDRFPAGPERTVALRKLLESRDCIGRCVLESEV